MITITERKLQTYLNSLIIITPNTNYDSGFCHIFRQKLVRSLFGQIIRLPMIRPHFFGAHLCWGPFFRCSFVPGPICPGHICPGAHLSGAHLSENLRHTINIKTQGLLYRFLRFDAVTCIAKLNS